MFQQLAVDDISMRAFTGVTYALFQPEGSSP